MWTCTIQVVPGMECRPALFSVPRGMECRLTVTPVAPGMECRPVLSHGVQGSVWFNHHLEALYYKGLEVMNHPKPM